MQKPRLTSIQAKVVKAKIKADLTGKTITEVAPTAFPGSTPESARVQMTRQLQNVTVQEVIAQAMADAGLTPDTLVDVVKEGMGAKRVVQIEGDFYETEVPDHSIRLKAAGMAASWLGVGKNSDNGSPVNFNFINVATADKGEYGV